MTHHPNQGPKAQHAGEVTDVDVASGVNEDGRPFVHLYVTGTTSRHRINLAGQLTTGIARTLGLNLLEAAEAAKSDGILFAIAGGAVPDDEPDGERRLELHRAAAANLIDQARNIRATSEAPYTVEAVPSDFDPTETEITGPPAGEGTEAGGDA